MVSFGLRQPPSAQDVVAVLAQRGHPRLAVRSRAVGLVAADHGRAAGFPTRATGFGASHRGRPAAAAAGRRARRAAAHPDPARPPHPPTARADSAARARPAARGRRPARRASCGAHRSSTPRRRPDRCSWPRDRPAHNRIRSAERSPTPRTPPRRGHRAGPSSSASTKVCSGIRSRSAAIRLVVPASHGPVTSTTSRLSTPGELSPGSIAATTASAAAIGSAHRTRPEQTQRAPGDVGAAAAVQGVDRTAAVPSPMHGPTQMRCRVVAASTRTPAASTTSTAAAITASTVSSVDRNSVNRSSPDCTASECNSVIADRTPAIPHRRARRPRGARRHGRPG